MRLSPNTSYQWQPINKRNLYSDSIPLCNLMGRSDVSNFVALDENKCESTLIKWTTFSSECHMAVVMMEAVASEIGKPSASVELN